MNKGIINKSKKQLLQYYKIYKEPDITRRKQIRKLILGKNIKLLRNAAELSQEIIKTDLDINLNIELAIFCIGIEGFNQDPRDSIAILSILNCTSKEKGINLDELIRVNLNLYNSNTKVFFENWINKEDKSVSQFGFTEVRDTDGRLLNIDLDQVFFLLIFYL